MVKLVAVDMNGTLLDPDGHISVHNAHVIRCMQSTGIELSVCTGRSYADALLPLGKAGLEAVVIYMSGASVYDWKGRLIHKQELIRSRVEHILEYCRNEDVIFNFITNRGSCTIAGGEEFRECSEHDILFPMVEYSYGNIGRRFTLIPPGGLLCRGLESYKISVIHESRQVLEQVKERLKAMEDLAATSSFIINLELTHIGAQKDKAPATYASVRNIRLDQVMAVGDSESDYSMLSIDLKYTIAMGNTMERIKNTARCQTRINVRDGVAYATENLVLYKETGRA